jgi:hypothetical protein
VQNDRLGLKREFGGEGMVRRDFLVVVILMLGLGEYNVSHK